MLYSLRSNRNKNWKSEASAVYNPSTTSTLEVSEASPTSPYFARTELVRSELGGRQCLIQKSGLDQRARNLLL